MIQFDSHRHYLFIGTTKSILNNPGGPQIDAIKYKFMIWIWLLFCLQMSSHILTLGQRLVFLLELKASVENPRGSVKKLCPKESVEGISSGNPSAAKPWGLRSLGFSALASPSEKSLGKHDTVPQHSVDIQGTLLKGQVFHAAPRIFNEILLLADLLHPPAHTSQYSSVRAQTSP